MGNESLSTHGVRTSTTDQVVAHVDMDCFYAACERRREPALEGEPVVVGMGYEADEVHGAVATASYEAREYGVESAMPISQALSALPRKVDAAGDPDLDVADAGFYRPVDMEFYESVAEEVREIIHDEAAVVREVSIDEAYLDVTDLVAWSEVDAWARDLKARIRAEVGVAASVGVAPTMSAAKVASDREKPNGMVVVRPGEVREFFADLPVEEVHGVGPVTARELSELGVETAGDLAAADPETLERRFGERGREIRRFARGEDERRVTPRGNPKSLSRESAFTDATDATETVRRRVRTLAEAVADRAARKAAQYQTIGIKVVEPPYDVNTRARSLPGPVEDPELVESVALDLLSEFDDVAVRKVGVRVSNLDFAAGEQASLDGFDGDGTGSDRPDDDSERGADQPSLDAFSDGGEPTDADVDAQASDSGAFPGRRPDGQTTLWEFV
ncbi:DNA polymerase IV [Halomicroarcula sp. GCM10025817]|uniref:DNA polymerase IV n=1 Tax=Haloarcula TaxID=2237 RepID=UPI0023E83E1B|nr:DNA polymerase IV [Halomicroarcula sp. SYNS111]